MKKLLVLLFLMAIGISASARKSYITVWADCFNGEAGQGGSSGYSWAIKMTGDVPDNIEGFKYETDYHYWYIITNVRKFSTGEILNVLSEYGYEVESMTNNGGSGSDVLFLLSKEIPDGQTISKGDVNIDGEVNIADVNEVISLILGYVREHPNLLEQYAK